MFKKLYGKEAEIIAYHCGIECGVLKNKIEGLQCISIGPNIFEIHTPKEHLSISSAERTFQYILEILKEMNNFSYKIIKRCYRIVCMEGRVLP